MNKRILKKLSKRAAVYLPLIDKRHITTPIKKDDLENCHTTIPCKDRKYWDRSFCHADYEPRSYGESRAYTQRKRQKRDGTFEIMRPSHTPLKNTPIVYFESKDDYSIDYAWSFLKDVVQNYFSDYSFANEDNGYMPKISRTFKTASDYLEGARDIIASNESLKA